MIILRMEYRLWKTWASDRNELALGFEVMDYQQRNHKDHPDNSRNRMFKLAANVLPVLGFR
jgi:hypothetical protein